MCAAAFSNGADGAKEIRVASADSTGMRSGPGAGGPAGLGHDPFLAPVSKNEGGITGLRDEVFGRVESAEGPQNPLALNNDERVCCLNYGLAKRSHTHTSVDEQKPCSSSGTGDTLGACLRELGTCKLARCLYNGTCG